MKKIILFLCLLSFMIVKSQTKEETIEWLNQKFAENKTEQNVVLIRLITKKGDTDETIGLFNHYGIIAYFYDFKPNQIDAIKLYQAEAGNYNIKFISHSGIKEKMIEYDNNREFKVASEKMTNSMNIVLDANYSEGTKLRKALIHLINLMGGNMLNDDLFND